MMMYPRFCSMLAAAGFCLLFFGLTIGTEADGGGGLLMVLFALATALDIPRKVDAWLKK